MESNSLEEVATQVIALAEQNLTFMKQIVDIRGGDMSSVLQQLDQEKASLLEQIANQRQFNLMTEKKTSLVNEYRIASLKQQIMSVSK